VEVVVQSVSQVEALEQQSANPQAAKAAGPHLLGVIVVDILVVEEAAPVLLPLPPPQPMLQPPLAIPQLFLYPALHLKLLAHQGSKTLGLIRLFPASAEEFQAYSDSS
jgi:hypothetical protein